MKKSKSIGPHVVNPSTVYSANALPKGATDIASAILKGREDSMADVCVLARAVLADGWQQAGHGSANQSVGLIEHLLEMHGQKNVRIEPGGAVMVRDFEPRRSGRLGVESEIIKAAGRIFDVFGNSTAWRDRADVSDIYESADWAQAMLYARAAFALDDRGLASAHGPNEAQRLNQNGGAT